MISLNVDGMDSVIANLQNLSEGLEEKVYQATANATMEVLAQASRNCPVVTGNLRRSIETKVSRTADGAIGEVYSNCEYAEVVHEGRHGKSGNPFMRNAIDQCRGRILDYYKGIGNE